METSRVPYRLWYSYSFCINTKPLYNSAMKGRNTNEGWAGQPERKECENLTQHLGHLITHVQERLLQMKQMQTMIGEREQSRVGWKSKENI